MKSINHITTVVTKGTATAWFDSKLRQHGKLLEASSNDGELEILQEDSGFAPVGKFWMETRTEHGEDVVAVVSEQPEGDTMRTVTIAEFYAAKGINPHQMAQMFLLSLGVVA